MRKNRVRLTESQLHKVIKESVKKVLREDATVDGAIPNAKEIVRTIRTLIDLIENAFIGQEDYQLTNSFTVDEFITILSETQLEFITDRGENGMEDKDFEY